MSGRSNDTSCDRADREDRPSGSKSRVFGTPVVLVVAMASVGCGVGRSVDERINAAVPPPPALVASKTALDALARAQPQVAGELEAAYKARMQERARVCARGYLPSAFASASRIHNDLKDKDCFARVDAELKAWLDARRIGLLLAASPLRAIPSLPPTVYQLGGAIESVDFASNAGVALVQEAGRYEAIDLATGATIARGTAPAGYAHALSSNGRVFALGGSGGVEIRETESGAVLATIPRIGPAEFHWVGNAGAIWKPGWMPDRKDSQQRGPVFLDFGSGVQTPIPVATGVVNRVIAQPGAAGRYILLSDSKLVQLQLAKNGDHLEAQVVAERKAPPMATWATHSGGLTSDESLYFGSGTHLEMLHLATLSTEDMPLDPLRLKDAVATPDPDRLLVSGDFPSVPGQGVEFALYSLRDRSMARVDPARLPSDRVVYVAPLRRNAAIQDARIVLLDGLQAAAALPINDYLELREQAADLRAHPGQVHALQNAAPEPLAAPPPPVTTANAAEQAERDNK